MSEVFIEHNIKDLQRALDTLPKEVTMRVLKQVAQTAERETLRRFRRSSRTWRHQPDFQVIQEVTPTSIELLVGTDDKVYGYVDRGTRPHWIAPRKPGYPLRFRSGYKAKTVPGVLNSGPGGAFGGWVRAMRVWHPGTRARGFSRMIFQEIGPMMRQKTLELIDKAIKRHFRVWGRG